MLEAGSSRATEILERRGAIIMNTHVVFQKREDDGWRRHGNVYVAKNALYLSGRETSLVCEDLARLCVGDRVEVVLGAVAGGIALAQNVGRHLEVLYDREVVSVFADKRGDELVLERNYDKQITGKRVVIVEDVINSGDTVRKLVALVKQYGGIIVGIVAICNRGGVEPGTEPNQVDAPYVRALINVNLMSWTRWECPLCREGVPINTSVGHGREFLEQLDRETTGVT